MAVPTLTSITPATGPTGGRTLVTIAGTGFAVPVPNASIHPTPEPTPTVRVQFVQTVPLEHSIGTTATTTVTREATDVQIISSTLLRCITPVGDHGNNGASLPANVVLTNLTSVGAAIPGETVTAANAYTYHLPSVVTRSDLARIVAALIAELKRQVCPETVLTVESDWDDEADDGTNHVASVKLPSLSLIGPRISRDGDWQNPARSSSATGTVWNTLRAFPVVDLEFDLVGAAAGMVEAINLLANTEDFFRRNPYLSVTTVENGSTTVEYWIEWTGDPGFAGSPNIDNVRSWRGSVVVHGVPLQGVAGVTNDLLVGIGESIETFDISTGYGVT